ncbi:MAG: hypothetical protein IPH23_06715 [Gammaproteobacteria bacterium]|nr:hypothetical protein [Gammaproteobacteria bacterium]
MKFISDIARNGAVQGDFTALLEVVHQALAEQSNLLAGTPNLAQLPAIYAPRKRMPVAARSSVGSIRHWQPSPHRRQTGPGRDNHRNPIADPSKKKAGPVWPGAVCDTTGPPGPRRGKITCAVSALESRDPACFWTSLQHACDLSAFGGRCVCRGFCS